MDNLIVDTLIWSSPCLDSPLGPVGSSGLRDRNQLLEEEIETEVSLTFVPEVLKLWEKLHF